MTILDAFFSIVMSPFHYGYLWLSSYITASLIFMILRVLYNLKIQVYNDDSKIQPSRKLAVFITGATSGIGLALAKYFHRKKFTIIVGYYSAEEPGYDELMNLRRGEETSIEFVDLNVRLQESIAKSYEHVRKFLDANNCKLYAIINNAGIAPRHTLLWNDRRNIVATTETNLIGPIMMIRQFVTLLAKCPNSRIINICSILAFTPYSFGDVYGATKTALAYITAATSHQLYKYKVKTVAIFPGDLIKNTAIMKNATATDDIVYDQLTKEERQLFDKDFKIFCNTNKRIASDVDRFHGTNSNGTNSKSNFVRSIRRSIYLNLTKLVGAIDNPNLEDSSFMCSFDNAICLKDPPPEMFAGNRFYNIVVSAFFDILPHKLRMFMVQTIAPLMYSN